MSIPIARRSLSSRIFWFALSTVTHTVAHFWSNAKQYVPVVERVQVPIATLPAELEGMTIAHLSDFHCGPHVHASSLRRAAEMAQAFKPDMIALTGDFVQRRTAYAAECAEALSVLKAPLGVHTVLGNHDFWDDDRVVAAALRRKGLAPLRNEARRVQRGGLPLYVVGLDDVRFHRADLSVRCEAFRPAPRRSCSYTSRILPTTRTPKTSCCNCPATHTAARSVCRGLAQYCCPAGGASTRWDCGARRAESGSIPRAESAWPCRPCA